MVLGHDFNSWGVETRRGSIPPLRRRAARAPKPQRRWLLQLSLPSPRCWPMPDVFQHGSRGESGWCSDMTSTHGVWRHAGVRFLLTGECICPAPNPAACGGLQSMERALGVGSRKLARCAPMPKMQPTRCSAACRSRKRPGRRRHMVGGVAFMHAFHSRGVQERVAPESGPAAALIPPFLPCLREAAVAAEQRRHARKDRVSAAGVSRAGAAT